MGTIASVAIKHMIENISKVIVYSVLCVGRTIEVFVHAFCFCKFLTHEHDVTVSTLYIAVLWYCIPDLWVVVSRTCTGYFV